MFNTPSLSSLYSRVYTAVTTCSYCYRYIIINLQESAFGSRNCAILAPRLRNSAKFIRTHLNESHVNAHRLVCFCFRSYFFFFILLNSKYARNSFTVLFWINCHVPTRKILRLFDGRVSRLVLVIHSCFPPGPRNCTCA